MRRREFVLQTCQAVSVATLATWLEGCGNGLSSGDSPSLSQTTATVVNRTITIVIDASSPLATVGGGVLVRTTSGDLLVARTAQDTFSALTAVCTHEGCTVTEFNGSTFVCPCHGSEFSTTGGVVRGPAAQSLAHFATQFANNVLTISI